MMMFLADKGCDIQNQKSKIEYVSSKYQYSCKWEGFSLQLTDFSAFTKEMVLSGQETPLLWKLWYYLQTANHAQCKNVSLATAALFTKGRHHLKQGTDNIHPP